MSVYRELWQLLDRRRRIRLIALLLVGACMALATLGGVAAVLPFFAMLSGAEPDRFGAFTGILLRLLPTNAGPPAALGAGLLLIALVAFSNLVNFLGSLAMARYAQETGVHLATALLDAYLHRDYPFHLEHPGSALLANVTHETSRVAVGVIHAGLLCASNFMTAALIVAGMMLVNPWASAGVMAALGVIYALIYLSSRNQLFQNGLALSRLHSRRTQTASESFRAIRELLLLGQQALFTTRFSALSQSMAGLQLRSQAIASLPRHALETLGVAALVAAALGLGAGAAAGDGAPWLARLTFLGVAAYRLLPAIQNLFASLVRLRFDAPAVHRLAQDLRAASGSVAPAPAMPPPDWADAPRRGIELRAVSFRYQPDLPPVFTKLDASIDAGMIVGLIGPSGSGKTTLCDLLAGLLEPQDGAILIDGRRLEPATRAAWRANVAYVPQQPVVLDASFAENVAFGTPPDQIDATRLQRALEGARLVEFVATLPARAHERLGEDGNRLSGGQRQRLGLARALYRDASLLLLDEPTSALDAATAREIIAALRAQRGARTIVLVCHDAESLAICDRIIELGEARPAG